MNKPLFRLLRLAKQKGYYVVTLLLLRDLRAGKLTDNFTQLQRKIKFELKLKDY